MGGETGVKGFSVVAVGRLWERCKSRPRLDNYSVCRIKNAPQRVRMANKQASIARIRRRDLHPPTRDIHYFIVGITNSACRAPSGQRAVTVFNRV